MNAHNKFSKTLSTHSKNLYLAKIAEKNSLYTKNVAIEKIMEHDESKYTSFTLLIEPGQEKRIIRALKSSRGCVIYVRKNENDTLDSSDKLEDFLCIIEGFSYSMHNLKNFKQIPTCSNSKPSVSYVVSNENVLNRRPNL